MKNDDKSEENIFGFAGRLPQIGRGCFLASGVKLIGDVTLEDEVSLWFNCVVRGDVAPIFIGEKTNVQDLSMLHVTEVHPLYIGKFVSVAHHVVIHGARIENSCLIGMGCIILDGVVVGENSLVAAGSVLPPGKIYPPGSLIKGQPARVERALSSEERDKIGQHYLSYVQYKNRYLQESNPC